MYPMLDLYNNLYSRQILKKNIYALNLIDIIKSQHLDESFICKYILNPTYQLSREEEEIDVVLVLQYQTHISIEMLNLWVQKNDYNNKIVRKRLDSVDNFDSLL